MPIIKSAKKRVRVIEKKSILNSKTKRSLKASIKEFAASLVNGKNVAEAQQKAQSEIDKAVKKGVISKNKAARKLSSLNAQAKKSGAPKAAAKPKAKKATPAPAKTAAKKAPAKKAATTKSAAKPKAKK